MTIGIAPNELAERLAADAEFGFAIRHWNAVVRLQFDDEGLDVRIEDGKAASCERATTEPAEVTISASTERWLELLAPVPAPGRGMQALASVPADHARPVQYSGFTVTADFERHYLPYGPAISRLLGVLRELHAGGTATPVPERYPFRDTDTATGRYVYYDLDGVEYRVYVETAGAGTPLLLQHTAGSDGRQWRHLLADPAMQARYTMVAYDLPFHGRSLPPSGTLWWQHPYAPSGEQLRRHILAIAQACSLDRPIFMGTSMGGQLAPELLAHCAEHFRAAVAINGWYHMDIAHGRTHDFLDHPRVSSRSYADSMYRATSPLAPEAYRREVAFIYASNAPGVYKGDNDYFNYDHDLRPDAHRIDTSRTPLTVVVGEYDPAAWLPGGAQELVDAIPGAQLVVLKGMSHFAMTDDPVAFNAAIASVLEALPAALNG